MKPARRRECLSISWKRRFEDSKCTLRQGKQGRTLTKMRFLQKRKEHKNVGSHVLGTCHLFRIQMERWGRRCNWYERVMAVILTISVQTQAKFANFFFFKCNKLKFYNFLGLNLFSLVLQIWKSFVNGFLIGGRSFKITSRSHPFFGWSKYIYCSKSIPGKIIISTHCPISWIKQIV